MGVSSLKNSSPILTPPRLAAEKTKQREPTFHLFGHPHSMETVIDISFCNVQMHFGRKFQSGQPVSRTKSHGCGSPTALVDTPGIPNQSLSSTLFPNIKYSTLTLRIQRESHHSQWHQSPDEAFVNTYPLESLINTSRALRAPRCSKRSSPLTPPDIRSPRTAQSLEHGSPARWSRATQGARRGRAQCCCHRPYTVELRRSARRASCGGTREARRGESLSGTMQRPLRIFLTSFSQGIGKSPLGREPWALNSCTPSSTASTGADGKPPPPVGVMSSQNHALQHVCAFPS